MAAIILEGPDGGGKSSFGDALARELGVPVFHDGGPSRDLEHCRERVFELEDQALSSDLFLRDRGCVFSDLIYKLALGIPLMLSQEEVLERVSVLGDNALLIYCRPPMDVLLKNMDALARSKPHKPPEYARQVRQSLPLIVEEYDRGVRRWAACGLPIIRYDYTSMRDNEVFDDIRVFVKRVTGK